MPTAYASLSIGERLRSLRLQKKLSQGEIEHRCGLIRCYTSRVEHGHTIPSIQTLEKFARALEVPLSQLFSKDAPTIEAPNRPGRKVTGEFVRARTTQDEHFLTQLGRLLPRIDEGDRRLLLQLARKMARR